MMIAFSSLSFHYYGWARDAAEEEDEKLRGRASPWQSFTETVLDDELELVSSE